MKAQRVEISSKTIIFTIALVLSLALVWQIKNIILLFLLCFIFTEILNPAVNWLQSQKLSRPISILLIYLLILTVITIALVIIVPVLIEQTSGLINTLPHLLENTQFFGVSAFNWSSQLRIIENLPQNIARTVFSIFSNIFLFFVVLVITYYLLLERPHFDDYSQKIFGNQGKTKATRLLNNLEKRLGSWFNAELLLMTVIGLLAYLGYLVLGLNFAVPLAIIAGLLEVVPNIGPTVSTLIASLVAFTISPLTALLTVAWGIIIQQLENNFIVPKIMKTTVGLHPLLTIALLLVGAKLAGVGGAVLAIPIYLTIESIVRVLLYGQK